MASKISTSDFKLLSKLPVYDTGNLVIPAELEQLTGLIHEIYVSECQLKWFTQKGREAYELMAFWRLRVGSLFYQLKEDLPHGRFENTADQLFPSIPKRTRASYMQFYRNFMSGAEKYTQLAGPTDPVQDDEAIDADLVDDEGNVIEPPPPPPRYIEELVRGDAHNLVATLGDYRQFQQAHSKLKTVVGEKTYTKLISESNPKPKKANPANRGTGKKRGPYGQKQPITPLPSDAIHMTEYYLSNWFDKGDYEAVERVLRYIKREAHPDRLQAICTIRFANPEPQA